MKEMDEVRVRLQATDDWDEKAVILLEWRKFVKSLTGEKRAEYERVADKSRAQLDENLAILDELTAKARAILDRIEARKNVAAT